MVMTLSDIIIDFLSGNIDYDTWEKRIDEFFQEAIMKEVEERLNETRHGT